MASSSVLHNFELALAQLSAPVGSRAGARTFANTSRSGCSVEIFAHVTVRSTSGGAHTAGASVSTSEALDESISWEASLDQAEEVLKALNRTGAVVAARWFDDSAHYAVPNRCASQFPPHYTYWQLYKLADCFSGLVLPRERQLKRSFSWVVRSRWDLGFLSPLPPLASLAPTHIYLPYNYWPFSDQFAITPRHLSARYFSVVDTFYEVGLLFRRLHKAAPLSYCCFQNLLSHFQ